MRCLYHCEKEATGIVDRKKLIQVLREAAYNAPVQEDFVKYEPGVVRGKKVKKVLIFCLQLIQSYLSFRVTAVSLTI